MLNKNSGFMRTVSGTKVTIRDPKAEDIKIEDIARALSMQCRFNGHVPEFYSVAQHSVIVSMICDEKDALWGLMHDSAEAYLGDIISPVKSVMKDFPRVEAYFMEAICAKFNLPLYMPSSVARADLETYLLEEECVRGFSNWPEGFRPHRLGWMTILPLGPKESEKLFMDRFKELTK